MNHSQPIFKEGSVVISIDEFENLIECKRELIQIKNDLKQFLGDTDGL